MCSQVCLIRWVVCLSYLIFVAVILSSVSRVLIIFSHCVLTLFSVCMWGGSQTTLSHLRTQMRWAASEIRICRSHWIPCISKLYYFLRAFWVASPCGKL